MAASPDRESRTRSFISQVSANWGTAELTVKTEDIRRSPAWDALESRVCVIVNLAGRVQKFEAALEDGRPYLGPPVPGEMSILPPRTRLAGWYRGDSITYAKLTIDVPSLHDTLSARLKHRDEFLFRGVERLAQLAEQGTDVARMAGESLAIALEHHLSHTYSVEPTAPAAAQPSGLWQHRLADYIDTHLEGQLSLDRLANVAGMSIREFLQAFRGAFETTPAQYVIERRLDRASWLLLNTSRDVAAIAAQAGFSSHSHLTDTMRRRRRVTPRLLRSR